MSILKKRSTAVVITILVIIIATLFGVHRSVGKQADKIEAQFYEGVYLKDEGYYQASIAGQLEVRESAALGLVSLASNYDSLSSETKSLRNARNELIEAESIEEKYLANEKLQKAYTALYDAFVAEDISAREISGAEDYAYLMDAAQQLIKSSDYNSTVAEFINSDLRAFPVNILKHIAFCDYPEYFEVEG